MNPTPDMPLQTFLIERPGPSERPARTEQTMRTSLIPTLFSLLLLALVGPALAATTDEAERVKRMVRAAAAYFQVHGPEAAFEAFQDPEGAFMDGELYVFAVDLDGNLHAFGPTPEFVGRNIIDLKSADGKATTRDMMRLVLDRGEGWYEYKWLNPQTQRVEEKVTFVQRIDGTPYWIGCGYYR